MDILSGYIKGDKEKQSNYREISTCSENLPRFFKGAEKYNRCKMKQNYKKKLPNESCTIVVSPKI